MKKSKSKSLKLSLIGISVFTTGVAAQNFNIPMIDISKTPKALHELITFLISNFSSASTIIAIIGLLIIIIAIIIWPFEKIKNTEIFSFFGKNYDYTLITGGESELPKLFSHYIDLFGSDIVPQSQMASWLHKNGEILKIIIQTNKNTVNYSLELIGFFDIEPLTSSGESKIRRSGARVGNVKKSDIHSGKGLTTPKAFYVGSIGCPVDAPKIHKGICMIFFILELQRLSSGRTITIYARPVSDSGAYLAKSLFKMNKRHRGPDKEVIWSKEINSDT